MRRYIFALILAGMSVAVNAMAETALPITFPTTTSSTVDATAVSRGHNLRVGGINADGNGIKRSSATPTPQGAPQQRRSGISPDALRRSGSRAAQNSPTALLLESFEECELQRDELPQGWTRTGNITSTDPMDHWYGISREFARQMYYPLPADGDMMMLMYYDYDYKDEMLVSPQFNIPAEGYELSYYWFTVPVWLYMIDREHVDFDAGEFTNREQVFDFEIQIKVDGGEWTPIYSLEEQFTDMSYSELSQLDYASLQKCILPLDAYAGKDVQIGFRYWGTDGNVLFLDGIRVDFPTPDAYYEPLPSHLFYGLSSDEYMQWLPTSVEFLPVNHPIEWVNCSDNDATTKYTWTYEALADDGSRTEEQSTNRHGLRVTYRPDYTSDYTLRNNLYYVPQLTARATSGATNSYSAPVGVLQAGGTPEFDFGEGNGGYVKYTAFSFDVLTEGLGRHVEECEELGFFEEPIFGYSPNHDAWWEHYSYPTGNPDGKYSYVDGFANLIIPHAEAPMVVKGVSAMAYGTIYPEAEFTCKIYRLQVNDRGEGVIEETPVCQKSIAGSDVIAIYSGLTRDFLTLNFPFDEPYVMSADDASFGYIVEISGYHDEKIEYFAPLQSTVPNQYEWCLGFYHHYWPFSTDLTSDMSYVAFFTDEFGRDLYSSFAIGLDAHYPWLEAAEGTDITIDGETGTATTLLHGYYDAAEYSVDAPEWLKASFSGRYSTEMRLEVTEKSGEDRTAEVTVSAPGVSCRFNVTALGEASVASTAADGYSADVYNLQGMLVRRACASHPLPAGIYISKGKKIIISDK